MSETLLRALRMPADLFWSDDALTRVEHDAMRLWAADEIEHYRAQVEGLKTALTEISEMGEGYATAMVITADKALDALREGE